MPDSRKLEARVKRLEQLVAGLASRQGVDGNLLQEWVCAAQDPNAHTEEAERLGRIVFERIKNDEDRRVA